MFNYEAVGKYKFKLLKNTVPSRWRTLYDESTPKSLTTNIKLNLEMQEKFAKSMYEF